MPHFRYRAVTHAGEIVIGEVEAPSRDEVVRRIEYLGHLTIEAEVAATGMLTRSRRIGGKPPRSARCLHASAPAGASARRRTDARCRAADAGRRHQQGAGWIRQQPARIDLRGRQLRRGAGTPFVDHRAGLCRHGARRRGIGQARGRCCARSSRIGRAGRALADRINSAIRYPLFLVGSAVVVLLFFLIYVVPQFEPVFKDLGGRLNSGAAFVVAVSSWLRLNLDLFLGFVCSGCSVPGSC